MKKASKVFEKTKLGFKKKYACFLNEKREKLLSLPFLLFLANNDINWCTRKIPVFS